MSDELQRRVRRARALELAEYRLERLTLRLEAMNKGMRIASYALRRFARTAASLPVGVVEEIE